jgi:hypothetical protein
MEFAKGNRAVNFAQAQKKEAEAPFTFFSFASRECKDSLRNRKGFLLAG